MDECDIPIDIHTSKLLDWLISRRHVPKDWQTKITTIRGKINEAINDMPENEEITTLLSGSYINYFHCLKLVEILKETEISSKNLFGQYSSKRMKDWLEIIKLYTKDNIYLGEAASLLLRNLNYEIPALKKQISKTIQMQNEYERKEVEYQKLAEINKKDFLSSCKALGIKGEKVKRELIEKAADFPQLNKTLVEEMKLLKPAMEFYQKTCKELSDNEDEVLKMLQFVIDRGDTTIYELKHNKPPSVIEANKLIFLEEETSENVENINFDAGITLDVDDIDWGITTEDQEEFKNDIDESVAKGTESFSVMGYPDTRNSVINDILELESFLKSRIYEVNSESEIFSSVCPDILQMYGKKSLQKMLGITQSVLTSLRDPTALHYLNITTNSRYVHQLAEKLENRMTIVEKMLASKEFVKKQRADVGKDTEHLKPKLNLIIQKTKELQDLIEQEISRKYNGRPVNLMAGANLL